MSKIDVVRAAMVEAMKAKDKARKDSLSMLQSRGLGDVYKRQPRKPMTWLRLTVRTSGGRLLPVWPFTGNLHRLT